MNTNAMVSRRGACAMGLAGFVALASARSAFADQAKDEKLPEPREVSFPVKITDDRGVEVSVESLDGVVAIMGSFAKTWELAGGTLVGASSDAVADYELDSTDVAVVGDFSAPNLEQVMALSPTLVIMSGASAGRGGQASQLDLVEPLEAAGIPVLTFTVSVFKDYLRMLRACCDLTGRDDLYVANGEKVAARVDSVIAQVSEAAKDFDAAPTCLIMTTYSGGTRVSTSTSQAGAILADLGAVNLADENPSLLKDFSLESVIAMDPDFIFALPMGDTTEAAEKALEDQTEANPAWAGLTAVQEDRFVILDPQLFLYKPLNNWDEPYALMAEVLYGIEAEEK